MCDHVGLKILHVANVMGRCFLPAKKIPPANAIAHEFIIYMNVTKSFCRIYPEGLERNLSEILGKTLEIIRKCWQEMWT